MTWDFGRQVVLITGAAGQGIGQGLARRFASENARVIITDAHERRTREVTEAIGRDLDAEVYGYPMDVTDRDRVVEVFDEVGAKVGPVQIVVNNAALNIQGDIWDYDPADYDRCMAVNIDGPWFISMIAGRRMIEAGVGGSIIQIGSVAGDTGGAYMEPPYALAKAALNALTRGLAFAGGKHGIRSNCIVMTLVRGTRYAEYLHPDQIDFYTPRVPLGRLASVDDIAATVAFLCSDEGAFITGEIVNVAGGWPMRP